MPRLKIEGVKQADAGKTCLVSHLELAENARDHIAETDYETLKGQVQDYGAVHTPLKCSVKPDRSGLLVWDGQQRYDIAVELGLERVPVIIMKGNKLDHLLTAGTGEGVKHDLVAEIRWVQMCERAGASREQIAKTKGVSTGWVASRLALAPLSETARAALRDGTIKLGRAKQLAKMEEPEQDAEVETIRRAKANGNSKAGKVAPKRPGLKTLRTTSEAFFHCKANDDVVGGFQLGIKYATGEVTAEQLSEQYGLEL